MGNIVGQTVTSPVGGCDLPRSLLILVLEFIVNLLSVCHDGHRRNRPIRSCAHWAPHVGYHISITAGFVRSLSLLGQVILSLLADLVGAQDVLQETNLVLIRMADDFQSDASSESLH